MRIKQDAVVLHAPKHTEYLGLSYKQIAKKEGISPAQVILQLLKEENLCLVNTSAPLPDETIINSMEHDFVTLLNKPYYNIGSDSIPCCSLPHPRSTGTFIKIIEIAKTNGVDFSVVANRTSYSAAQLYALKDRGVIKQGAYADLVVFDPKSISSQATYSNPFNKNLGIKHVVVNGMFAMENGQLLDTFSGMKLRRES